VVAEGPQVLRRTEWLQKHLASRTVRRCQSTRDEISSDLFEDQRVRQSFCKGKHIFLEFGLDLFLHNHLMMRGTWIKREGPQPFLPPNTWIAFDVGPYTVCNIAGQMLKVGTRDDVDTELAALGPDAMSKPFPEGQIVERFFAYPSPIAQALLDQQLIAGIGNIAKSEILFSAAIDPRTKANELDDGEMARLIRAIPSTLWESYHNGGRWTCRVCRKEGKACITCGGSIQSLKQPPSRRATYFCPTCHSSSQARGLLFQQYLRGGQ
jgi:endonuclease-8